SIPLPIPVQDGNSQQEEIDIVTKTDDVLPSSIEIFAEDPEGDIRFLEELLIDDSILFDELSDANFKETPLIPRPPPKPPDVETDAEEEIPVMMNDKDKDVDYSSFILVIYLEMFPFLLSAESEDTIFDPDEIKCDMPAKDDCSPVFTTFSNPLFKDNDDLDSSDDESLPDEDVPAEEFKFYSNPLCDEDKINSDKLDPQCFNVESDFVEYLLNRDTFIDFSSKFDFSGKLTHIKPEIPKSDFDFEEEIRLIENLLYDNSFPRPPEEINAEIADTIFESILLLPILVQDGNSQQEEIDIVTKTDDVLPPSIENFADDPEGDIRFLEELLIDDSILFYELSDANFEENPLIPRPPPKSPDVETDAGGKIAVVMINKDKFDDDYQIFMFDKVLSLLSAESEDMIFDPGVSPGD
nr:hypothetical protein [Tanacetum cinerariifolium]